MKIGRKFKEVLKNIIYYLRNQKKQTQPKASRRKEIIIIRMEINKLEDGETVDRISKTSILFFKKINKIDKSLTRLTKKKREDSNF